MADPRPSPRFTIVVPVFEEAAFLPEALPRLFADLDGLDGDYEVLLVENGSTDGTAEVAESYRERWPQLKILRLPEPDYGAALRLGLREGRGAWRVVFNIDYFSRSFVDHVAQRGDDADVILASKRAEGADDRRSWVRRLATSVFSGLVRALFGSRLTDTHGIKALRAEVVDAVEPHVVTNRDLFDTEFVLRAERDGWRIVEVPAEVEELRATRSSLAGRIPRTVLGLLRLRLLMGRAGRTRNGTRSGA